MTATPLVLPWSGQARPVLLLAASTGGHLAELVRIEAALGSAPESLWITFDTPQSRSLLAGRRVLHVPEVTQRDLAGTVRAARLVRRLLRTSDVRFDGALSTGAAIAAAVLPAARSRRIPAVYVESMTRTEGPSMTGRLLEAVPGVRLVRQSDLWERRGWSHWAGVAASWRRAPSAAGPVRRVFVTLGTTRKYPFDALLDALARVLPPGVEVTWQVPYAPRRTLPGTVVEQIRPERFDELAREADVTVCHGGAGSLLRLWELGVHPLVVPRRAARGEHVDDHQAQIARLVEGHGLGRVVEAPDLRWEDVVEAGRHVVVDRGQHAGSSANA
ncbi:glycosyltransferase [Cellulomonas xiejunii]|uniref:glycosyltransferase n=1 Tax=Cellulomonas xiejunii TaxID=2968083 RepID=UPI001D0EAAAD|nr:glycosyltransferase [Cellulomonas xiejunii]MCC2314577.1 hypothetical protein [Cellulomonas xiejunii]